MTIATTTTTAAETRSISLRTSSGYSARSLSESGDDESYDALEETRYRVGELIESLAVALDGHELPPRLGFRLRGLRGRL